LADEVEITNVGGDNGVASEATLLLLLNSFDKMAKGQGIEARKAKEAAKKYHDEMKNGIKVIKDEKEAREENTDALDANTRSLNMFRSGLSVLVTGISGLIGGVSNFAEELAFGRNRLSDFAQHVPLIGGPLSVLTGFVDDSVDTFRELSQVGATFAGGLTEFRRLAGEAAMPLDEFGRLVQENSESLKLFGKDTAMGARNFAAMSNEFRRGVGKELLNLGFTSSELNDTLMDFAEIQAMIFGAERAQSMITTQNAGEFAHQLQRLSAITGKRRDQIAEEMMQTMSDARARMAIASMSEEEQKRFQANLAQTPEALKSVFVDMADGIPNEEITQRLMQFSDTFREQASNIQNMSEREFNNFLVGVRNDLEASGENMGDGFQAILASVPGLAEAFGSMTELQKRRILGEEEYRKLQEEQQRAAARDDSILQFEETLNRIRGNLQVAFVESGILQVVENLAGKFADFLNDPKTIDGLKSALMSVSMFFEGFIQDIQTMGFWNTIKNTLVEGFSSLMQEAKLFLFGGVRDNTEKLERKRLEETQGETVEGKFEGLGGLFGINQPDNSEEIADIENQIAELQQQRSEITKPGGAGRKERRDIDSQISELASQKEQLEGGGFLDSLSKVADILAPGGALLAGVGILAGALALVGAKASLVAIAIGFAGFGVGAALNGISNVIDSVTNGFKTMSDELEDMSNIDASSLAAVASSMDEIGSTMIKMAGAGIIEAISSGGGSNFLKSMGEGFKTYENIDGSALTSAKDGIVAVSEALKIFNEAVTINSLGDFASRLIGTDDFVNGLVSLAQGLEPIDGNKLQNVAPGVEAVSRALEVFKSSTGFQGLGDLVSSWFSGDAVEVGSKIAQIATDLSVMNPSQVTAVSKSIKDMSGAFTAFSDAQVEDFNFRRTAINRFERLAQLGPGLESVSTHMTDIAGITGLDSQLEVLNNGLDVDKVNNYAEAMEKLVEVLEDLNKALAEDNEGLFGGTGVAAADVIENMNTANQGSSDAIQELNSTMMQVLAVLRQTKTIDERIEKNTSSMGGNIANGRVSNIR